MLSNLDILEEIKDGRIEILPHPTTKQIQPASIDLRLGNSFVVYKPFIRGGQFVQDVHEPVDDRIATKVVADSEFVLGPQEFALATTVETIGVPANMLARVDGRSSMGRLGLAIHVTAGFIDPGFKGEITLELYNHSPNSLRLHTGMRICQVCFMRLETPTDIPYSGKYNQQKGAQVSRINEDFS
jgi:dCTP deaminase